MTAPIIKAKYVIIGNSAGGIGAAEAIREVDTNGSIIIASNEPYPAYSRPLISEYLAGKRTLDTMLFRPADFYQKNRIDVFLGSRVARIDSGRHTAELADGKKIAWEKLLLATGGAPIVPAIPGGDKKRIFTFTTLDDARAIEQCRTGRVVVVGGGLIGVSVTEALVRRGGKVVIVEMKERILNTILDETASVLVTERLKQAGVSVITGHTVAQVTSYSTDGVTGVTLEDDTPIPCHVVLLAIGVKPRVELAADAGIKVNRGIVVDRYMATSCPDVYACGDAAEAYDFVYGDCRAIPVWPGAYLGGRTAGLNMAGIPTEYPGITAMNSLKYFGLSIISAGVVAPPDDSYEVLSQRQGNTYRKIVLKDGVVVGMLFTGNVEKAGIVFNLMKSRVNVSDFKERLVAADFGLASLPEAIWRPLLEMPQSAAHAEPVALKD